MNNLHNKPGYQILRESGELAIRVDRAMQILSCCTLCPRRCRVDRINGEKGFCGGGDQIRIADFGAHFGEELPISGKKGAGTIFFAHCALRCCFCQNYQISQEGTGYLVSEERLAEVMMDLQDRGCHNIDLVTPTHYIPFILKSVYLAAEKGLQVPLIYNCSGYESVETLRLLDGIIDIYLPDWKYGEEDIAEEYSNAPAYPLICQSAVKEMHRQVGDIRVDEEGIAQKGVIVRHLVLPSHLSNSERVLSLIVRTLSPSIRISLMSQYVPTYQAHHHPRLNRSLLPEEYEEVRKMMEGFNFDEYWIQELERNESCLPDFKEKDPFPEQLLSR
ncbi:MAG: radical SAM protein [Proteobacteria bacterium]|nr:radical SAM protein [Pseudomonadota bacterium]